MSPASNKAFGFFGDARPEHQLLLSCARARIDPETAARIRRLITSAIDWDCLLHLAARHHLLPLLYRNLDRSCARDVPKPVFASLWAHFAAVARRNETLSRELVRLVQHFESHGIAVIPYKGPTAATAFYGDVGLREFGDLDFLVRREDLSKLCEVLEADGYQPRTQRTPMQRAHHEREAKEYLYCRRKAPLDTGPTETVCLEPHWSITQRKFPFPIDYPDLWRHARRVELLGTELLSFAPQDAILILCAVGSKSQWKRLLMICDFAEAARTLEDSDWAHCLERAEKLGCKRMLLTAVLLAGELLDSIPSPELLAQARSDPKVARLAKALYDNLFLEAKRSVSQPALFSPLLWRMRERPGDKLLYLFRTLTTPRDTHLRRIPLPKPLFPLYRLIVPVHDYLLRPAWRTGARVWKRWPANS